MSRPVTTGRPIEAGLTGALAEGLLALHVPAMPEAVRREAGRTLLNVLGTAVGASHNAAVEIELRHAVEHGGRPVAPVPGRRERVDLHHAALATGIAAHVDDYDDTHLATVIHPGGPVVLTDDRMPRDATRMVFRMQDGRVEETFVDHVEPLDDDRLASKACALLEPILGSAAGDAVEKLIAVRGSDTIASVVAAVTPVS